MGLLHKRRAGDVKRRSYSGIVIPPETRAGRAQFSTGLFLYPCSLAAYEGPRENKLGGRPFMQNRHMRNALLRFAK